jgi:hypothetical protein
MSPDEAIRETHPTLHRTVAERYDAWRKLVDGDRDNERWEGRLPDGTSLLKHHASALFSMDEVMARGDQPCTALYPVRYYVDAPMAKADGDKVKPKSPMMLATFAVVGDLIVIIVQMDERMWMPLLFERSDVASTRWVKAGGLLVVPKLPGLQFEIVQEGERDQELVCFAQLLRDGDLEALRKTVTAALTG